MRNAIRISAAITLGRVPDGDDLAQLKYLGCKTVVDVREEEEKFGGLVQERAQALGIKYVSIPIRRDAIEVQDVLQFYRAAFDRENAPLYAFSRFGKKPLAFLVLFEAVANNEPLVRVFQRASRMGMDLRGDLCLQEFLVEFFNSDRREEIKKAIVEYRSDLLMEKEEGACARSGVIEPRSPLPSYVNREQREKMMKQRGCTVWLTGLPASGKSTTAFTLEAELTRRGYLAYVIDSDNIRHGLNSDLGFTSDDRTENIRRIGQVARLLADAGMVMISSFISPYRKDRELAQRLHQSAGLGFVEVFIDTPAQICEHRDPRGLYKRARDGEILNFTGVDDLYEAPRQPALAVKPAEKSPQQIAVQIADYLVDNQFLNV